MLNMLEENIYFLNYPKMDKDLCQMEMRALFKKSSEKKYVFSDVKINPSRSPFIKSAISIIYNEDSLEKIISNIKEDKLSYDDFKVNYVKSEDGDVEYSDRLKAVRDIGFVVTGFPDLHNPKIELAVTKVNGRWVFGQWIKNDFKWQNHNNKPYSYSNAISLRMARALVNIAVGTNLSLSLIDPCCGIGTVILEALDFGINVKGREISKQIACNARNNIEHFGYERDIIVCADMHEINENYDVAIVDIPYGLFSPTTLEAQKAIIKTARRIAKKIIIVTFEDMDKHITEAGFTIKDRCLVVKGNFKRYILSCE